MFPFLPRVGPFGRGTRRDWLALGLGALAAPSLAKPVTKPRAKSVLVVFTSGGMSQFESFDPKPNAPEEIRGAFGSTATRVPGLRFCEHLANTAAIADRFAVVRSVTHDDVDHGSACYLALTGQFHPRKSSNPAVSPTDFPTLGAIVQRVRPGDRFPRAAVHLNGPILLPELTGPGNSAGLLGRGFDPLVIGNPDQADEFVGGLTLPADVSKQRLDTRRELLDQMQRRQRDAHADTVRTAFDLLDTKRVREAFDLSREPDEVRDAYGRYRAGQTCLLARRLVEAGVPWVTAFFNHTIRGQDKHPGTTDEYGWDTHNDIFTAMKDHLLPRFDKTFSTLLDDLHARGLLKDTLVVCMGEFGRAPRVALEKNFDGTTPGRKHWAGCYSVLLAGAGVVGGSVYGASDRHAAYPQSHPVSPGDLTATLFHALGIDPAGHYTDPADRPYRVATGEPLTKIFS